MPEPPPKKNRKGRGENSHCFVSLPNLLAFVIAYDGVLFGDRFSQRFEFGKSLPHAPSNLEIFNMRFAEVNKRTFKARGTIATAIVFEEHPQKQASRGNYFDNLVI